MHVRYELFEQREGAAVQSVAFCPREAVVAFQLSAGGARVLACSYESRFEPPSFSLGAAFAEHKFEALTAMSWSIGGAFLFVAASRAVSTLALSAQLGAPSLQKTEHFEDRSEILCLACGADESELFYGTLDGRVSRLRRREQLAQRQFENKIVAIVADPLRSYVGVLSLENTFTVCDLALQPERVVDLSLRAREGLSRAQFVLREDRKVDLSPDLQCVVLPSLEDKRLPLALALAPPRAFAVEAVFAGSFAPITVIRFLPAIFARGGAPFCVFAMGDGHGNIAFWELNATEKPIFLLKSDELNLTIETIDFSADTSTMIATTNRRFLIVALISPSLFGADALTLRREQLRGLLGSDLRDFRPLSYRDLRGARDASQPIAAAPRKLAFKKRGDERAEAERGAEPRASPPRVARHLLARPRALGQFVVALDDGCVVLGGEDGKSVLRFLRDGDELWRAGGFGAVSHLVCSAQFVLVANDRDFVFFLDRQSGVRCHRRLLFPKLFDVQISADGVAAFANTRGEFALYDVRARRAIASDSFERLLVESLEAFGDEKPENVFSSLALSLAVDSENRFTICLFGQTYNYDAALKAWWRVSPFADERERLPFEDWSDPADILFALFTADPREHIGDVEERIVGAALANDRAAFSDAMKEYFANLARNGEYARLQSYLINRIAIDESSAERIFLEKMGISAETVLANAINVVSHFDNSADFVQFFRTFLREKPNIL